MKLKYLILFFIAIYSCDNHTESTTDIFDLVKKNRIYFPVDESINPYGINIQFVPLKGNDSRLYILCNDNQLLIYNFSNRKLIKKIILEKEGNIGIGNANGFKVISKDSILFTSTFYQKLFLVNSEGKVLKNYSFKCDSLFTSYAASDLRHSLYFMNNEIVVPQNLSGNWNHISKEYFDKYSTTINIDCQTGKIRKTGIGLPFLYPNVAFPSFSFVQINKSFLYSFGALDSLYMLDANGKTKAFFAKTNNIKNLVNTKRRNDSSIESILRDKVKNGEYGNLFYDSFNKVVYRFYKVGEEKISNDYDLMDLNSFPPTFGIQVFDININKLADLVFPKETYFFYNSFVAPDGLYISANHPNNPDFDINYFCFDHFKIQQK